MTDLRTDFTDRVAEIDAYLGLVSAVEQATRTGTPILPTETGTVVRVSPLQQQILYAGVYMHLYNLVEATLSQCITAVETAASAGTRWKPADLSAKLRREWVKSIARTHESLNDENRLEATLDLCNHLVEMLPVSVKISKGGGGNWDDEQISEFAKRLGLQISLKQTTYSEVKRPFRDGQGALKLIKTRRNMLAHGEMSFAECGYAHSHAELAKLKDRTCSYLDEVISCFESYITQHEFLDLAKRPP